MTTVETAETWTLGPNGQLMDPEGNVLETDGSSINALPSSVISSERLSPYTCTLDSTSTSDTAVLDCTAKPNSGATSSFVLCAGGRLASTEEGCSGSVEQTFDHLILGPIRATQPPAQPPTTGTLSFVGSQSQLLGEVVANGYSQGIEPLEVVTQGQVWTLSTDGNLVSFSGGVLQTDGQIVYGSTQTEGSPYVCSTASGSTASVAVLNCKAAVLQDDGTASYSTSFALCQDGQVQANPASCDSSTSFSQLTLTVG